MFISIEPKFFEFIKEMDLYAPENTEIVTQLSIDGPQGGYAEQGHNVSLEAYQKNISDFTFLVNNYKLKNVKITFQINATLNKETYMEKFSNYVEGCRTILLDKIDNCKV